jgi:hypothetical protein
MFNVPIILNSNDKVCTLVIALSWNQSQATYVGIQKGSGAPNGEFSVDSTRPGYANIVIDNALNPMAGQVAIVQFDGDPGTAFTSSGISASDSLGRLMNVSSSGPNITTNGIRADYATYDPTCWNPGGACHQTSGNWQWGNPQGVTNNMQMIIGGTPGPTLETVTPPINPSTPAPVNIPPKTDYVVLPPIGTTLDTSATSNVSSGLSGILSSLTSSPNFVTYLAIGVGAYFLLGKHKR